MQKRIEDFAELHACGMMDVYDILKNVHGWNAYAMHANTHKFMVSLLRKLRKSLRQKNLF